MEGLEKLCIDRGEDGEVVAGTPIGTGRASPGNKKRIVQGTVSDNSPQSLVGKKVCLISYGVVSASGRVVLVEGYNGSLEITLV